MAIDFEASPMGGVLLVSVLGLLAIGFLTLTGTVALALWAGVVLIVAAVAYGLGKRIARRLRGERRASSGSGGDW